jgi:RluA family pseudouridine synthase
MSAPKTPNRKFLPRGLDILFEDKHIIVVDKPAGLLTMATRTETEKTAHWALSDYVRKGQAKSREQAWLVHRLDRETSGVLIFARSELMRDRLQASWEEVNKTYVAVVHGQVTPKEDTISSFLIEELNYRVHSTKNADHGKLAHTKYRVIEQTLRMALVEIDLLTGRKHQIRVHFSERGNPIVGDEMYGSAKGNSEGRLALHARRIEFPHPATGEMMRFEAPLPGTFMGLIRGSRKPLPVPEPAPQGGGSFKQPGQTRSAAPVAASAQTSPTSTRPPTTAPTATESGRPSNGEKSGTGPSRPPHKHKAGPSGKPAAQHSPKVMRDAEVAPTSEKPPATAVPPGRTPPARGNRRAQGDKR